MATLSLQLREELNKAHVLLFYCTREYLLTDCRVGTHLLLANLDMHRLFNIAAVLTSESLHLFGPCSAKHESLAVRAHVAHNALQLLLEAHVLQQSTYYSSLEVGNVCHARELARLKF